MLRYDVHHDDIIMFLSDISAVRRYDIEANTSNLQVNDSEV